MGTRPSTMPFNALHAIAIASLIFSSLLSATLAQDPKVITLYEIEAEPTDPSDPAYITFAFIQGASAISTDAQGVTHYGVEVVRSADPSISPDGEVTLIPLDGPTTETVTYGVDASRVLLSFQATETLRGHVYSSDYHNDCTHNIDSDSPLGEDSDIVCIESQVVVEAPISDGATITATLVATASGRPAGFVTIINTPGGGIVSTQNTPASLPSSISGVSDSTEKPRDSSANLSLCLQTAAVVFGTMVGVYLVI